MTDLELKLIREIADVLAKYEKLEKDSATLRQSNNAFSSELTLLGAMLYDISNVIYKENKVQMPTLLKNVCDIFAKRAPLKGEGTFVKKIIIRRGETDDKVLVEWTKFIQKMEDAYRRSYGKKKKGKR